MAKSYTVVEAIEILERMDNHDEVTSLVKHAPLFAVRVSKLLAKAPEEFKAFAACLPEYVTTTKINNNLRKVSTACECTGECTECEHEEVKAMDSDAPASKDYDSMSSTEIKALIDERGLRDLCREHFGNARKPNAIKLLKAIDAGEIVVGDTADATDTEEDPVEEETSGKYDGIPAMKLFKMCKERGIKCKPKHPAKYYVELLEEDDAKAVEADDDDDWDDEPDVEPVKEEAPKENTGEDFDDDDDWDI